MSYYCKIAFKTIESDKIFDFFKSLKKEAKAKLNDIAQDTAYYCPAQRYSDFNNNKRSIKNEHNRYWSNMCFTFRYFYIPEHKLLGIFGIHDQLDHLFDNITSFQNSCDRDYELDTWKNVKLFEKIADKWCNADIVEIKADYKKRYGCDFTDDYDENDEQIIPADTCEYHRRQAVYDEIWDMLEKYLYTEDETVCVSLFNDHTAIEMLTFADLCNDFAEKDMEEYVKIATRKNMNKNKEKVLETDISHTERR